ncbi:MULTISPECIES: hypothetical protein [Methylobacterium]|uniref:DUF1508 domain-containing protein n=1 Tax=Methylobacterium thuringiense TaxID=1003091 RepID=A0ABQ4TER4_9HYPH|nr:MULTISPECIES: hypothetical protein [Methylobacterium]GJE53864.1 hypothetical protein EKPJFOCH_0332 [Methylobacterium thuringiense]
MASPHYVIRRSRSGRFNFTLLAEHGRINGVVVVPTENRSKEEVAQHAREKIRALADDLATVANRTALPS